MNTETRNPYFEAVEVRTMEKANHYFRRLLIDAVNEDPAKTTNESKESVVAGLCYVAGYYGEETRRNVARLYSWRSPYRQAHRLAPSDERER